MTRKRGPAKTQAVRDREEYETARGRFEREREQLQILRLGLLALLDDGQDLTPARAKQALASCDLFVFHARKVKLELIPQLDSKYTRYLGLSSASPRTGAENLAPAQQRPWLASRQTLRTIEEELRAELDAQRDTWVQGVRKSALSALGAAESRLRVTLEACASAPGGEYATKYRELEAGEQARALRDDAATWYQEWDEALSTSIDLESTEAVCAARVAAREVRSSVEASADQAGTRYERSLNGPRPRAMIELFPVGWDRVVPASPPAERGFLRRSDWLK